MSSNTFKLFLDDIFSFKLSKDKFSIFDEGNDDELKKLIRKENDD